MSIRFGSVSGAWRKRRRLHLVLTGAGIVFCTSLFFTAIFLSWSNSDATKRAPGSVESDLPSGTVAVMVANSDLPKGKKLTEADVRRVPWPRDAVPEDAARSFDEVENRYATSTLSDSLPVRRNALSLTPPSYGIEDELPPGYRAIAINVTATTSVESHASAGAHVDVLLTYSDPRDGQITTMVVAENAIVLSFGGEADKSRREESVRTPADMQVSTATLAVSMKDSLKIPTALAMGRISLVLRPKDETGSPGALVFRGPDFFERRQKFGASEPRRPSTGNYARFRGPDGNDQEYRLDEKGWTSQSID